jgi:thymidine kinase
METKVAGGPAFSEKFKELLQRIESRDATKQMSDEELKNLKRAIDDEMIRREVVKRIYILAEQLK